MRPHHVTREDEAARLSHLIQLLLRRPPIRKLQSTLEAVGAIWSPPDHLGSMKGVKWQVRPTADQVAAVAAHHASELVEVRRRVLVALQHATPHADQAARAARAGLMERDALLRISAARAAANLGLGHALFEPLVACLADPVWTVRWNAARALAPTDARPAAIDALLRSRLPRPETDHERWLFLVDGEWVRCALEFCSDAAVRAELLELGWQPPTTGSK
jgi:hypothetical protein